MTLNDVTTWGATSGAPAPENASTRPRARRSLLLQGVRLDRTGQAEPWEPASVEHLRQLTDWVGLRPRGTVELIGILERAGLTGHGGAHVPAALKWRAALRASGPLTVVANGAESEPLSAKDATLMRQRPHLVLDGLAITAEALGARRAVVWLHGDDDGSRAAMDAAIAERRAAQLQEPWMEIVSGPTHYLAGESSAIAQAMGGGPALPTARRAEDASTARPRTLVHNVETLARLALIARGYPPMPTMLLTVLTPLDRQVLEVGRGTSVTEVLGATGWLRGRPPKAVLLGGYGGMWVRWRDIENATFDEDALRAGGLTAGAGVVAPIPYGACGIAETAAIAAYLASMSARQCGPCLFGLPALADSVRLLADGVAPRRERARLLDDLRAVAGRGACHHPDGATRLIASALGVFDRLRDAPAPGRPGPGSHHVALPVPRTSR
jgi:NADH:ubiquinone oxidoreductase subunit F (NADH-binding)